MTWKEGGLILFDGQCILCDSAVQFVLRRDPEAYFKFASLQSSLGQQLLQKYQLPKHSLSTLVLIENERIFIRSTAGLRVLRKLKNPSPLGYVFIVIPAFLRNLVYRFIAANRYRWFGKKEVCRLRTTEEQSRFLS